MKMKARWKEKNRGFCDVWRDFEKAPSGLYPVENGTDIPYFILRRNIFCKIAFNRLGIY